MSRNHYRSYSRSPSGNPPMESHMRHHDPRHVAEMMAMRHHQQRQIMSEHQWCAHQESLRAAEYERASAEEARAEAKYILKERQRRDPEFAYKMQDPVYAQKMLRETIYAVQKERAAANQSSKSVRFAPKEMPRVPGYRSRPDDQVNSPFIKHEELPTAPIRTLKIQESAAEGPTEGFAKESNRTQGNAYHSPARTLQTQESVAEGPTEGLTKESDRTQGSAYHSLVRTLQTQESVAEGPTEGSHIRRITNAFLGIFKNFSK